MKKILLSISLVMLFVLLTGCKKDNANNPGTSDTVTPTAQPTVTVPVEGTSPGVTVAPTETLTVQDYFPFQVDTEYVYEGEGNEFAAMNVWTDYADSNSSRIQTRADNGGSEIVKVIEIKDGKLTLITSVGECYYRDNLLDTEASDKSEVLLMEPLVKGTQWTLPDNSKRYISNTEVSVETPLGTYQALEVTTEGTDHKTIDYYAPNKGLIKTVYQSAVSEISSTLKEIKLNTSFTQVVELYYPDQDEKIYPKQKTLSFYTNDNTGTVMEEAVRGDLAKDTSLPLISANTAINSLYLGTDKIVYIDFSKELITDMNAGAGYEALILQSITNTLGNYYGVQEVAITVDGKPYESGHILLKEGETIKVNMDNVIR